MALMQIELRSVVMLVGTRCVMLLCCMLARVRINEVVDVAVETFVMKGVRVKRGDTGRCELVSTSFGMLVAVCLVLMNAGDLLM